MTGQKPRCHSFDVRVEGRVNSKRIGQVSCANAAVKNRKSKCDRHPLNFKGTSGDPLHNLANRSARDAGDTNSITRSRRFAPKRLLSRSTHVRSGITCFFLGSNSTAILRTFLTARPYGLSQDRCVHNPAERKCEAGGQCRQPLLMAYFIAASNMPTAARRRASADHSRSNPLYPYRPRTLSYTGTSSRQL